MEQKAFTTEALLLSMRNPSELAVPFSTSKVHFASGPLFISKFMRYGLRFHYGDIPSAIDNIRENLEGFYVRPIDLVPVCRIRNIYGGTMSGQGEIARDTYNLKDASYEFLTINGPPYYFDMIYVYKMSQDLSDTEIETREFTLTDRIKVIDGPSVQKAILEISM
jgi:hypothetical protein